MCGIYGNTELLSNEFIKQRMNSIHFRGPDYQGYEKFSHCVLAHNRLSIIDLDKRSHQPFNYEHLAITYNGEVYNYLDIKAELSAIGYTFRTNSDTEIILAAYLQWGEGFLSKLNGMFAFVIYNDKTKCFFGARDRMGQKPFYYSLKDGHFEFSSDIYPLSKSNTNLSISNEAISHFLNWGNIVEPLSIYSEINKLEAGYCFNYSITNKSFEKKPYWDIDQYEAYTDSFGVATTKLDELLTDAVTSRMIADVPLGVFLSGGIDSSMVAAIAQRNSSTKINTFSIKFEEAKYDESAYARKVAQAIGSKHNEIVCSFKEGIKLIDQFSQYYQEPFADSSAIPTMLLSNHTAQHVTVALSGDGGDECFIGYERYNWIKNAAHLYKIPLPIRKVIGRLTACSPNIKHQKIGVGLQINRIEMLYLDMLSSLKKEWILPEYRNPKNIYLNQLSSQKNLLERISDYDLKVFLNADINTKVDRGAMAFSLETRSPFLDHRIVSFAQSLPTDYKFQPRNQKRILKEVLYKYVDKSIFQRPKMGFAVPMAHWFRKELKDLVLDTLSLGKLKDIQYIDPIKTKQLIDNHMNLKEDKSPEIWRLLVLSQWMENNNK